MPVELITSPCRDPKLKIRGRPRGVAPGRRSLNAKRKPHTNGNGSPNQLIPLALGCENGWAKL
jgi:hypothetical protein